MLGTTDYNILVAVFSHARIIQPPVNILWCSWHIVYFLLSLWSKLWLEISLASISETLESSSRDYYTSTHWFIVVIMLVHSVFGFTDSVLLDGFFRTRFIRVGHRATFHCHLDMPKHGFYYTGLHTCEVTVYLQTLHNPDLALDNSRSRQDTNRICGL